MKDALGHGSAAHALASGPKSAVPPVHEAHMPAAGFFGRVSAKNGRAMGTYGPHPTREAAAAEALSKHPKAKTASTYRGYGMDIQWTNR